MLTPGRLILARHRRGLTRLQLARVTGINPKVVSAYEAGRRRPTASTIALLAKALGFPAAFLQADDVEGIPLAASCLRASATLTVRQRRAALAAARIAVLVSDWVDSRFGPPRGDLPTVCGLDTEAAARVLRAYFGCGLAPISDAIRLAEAHGVRMLALPGDCAGVDSFCFTWAGRPFVMLNTAASADAKRHALAYHLAHLVVHRHPATVADPGAAHRQAEAFAAAFLLPRSAMIPLAHAAFRRLLDESRRWRVAPATLADRLHQLGLLDDEHHRALRVDIAEHVTDQIALTGRPTDLVHEHSPRWETVLRRLRDHHLTLAGIAHHLHLHPPDLVAYLLGLTPLALDGHAADTARANRPPLRLLTNS